ncbi:MAG TPA: hypothetical protein ENN76_01900, partial [Euryarchaeota archaeon]|nr:hypothetical protein [Euryarchaeota archaeon]
MKVSVTSPSNIALIKYWGVNSRGEPLNPSLSMTFDSLYSQTTVEDGHSSDVLILNGKEAVGLSRTRMGEHLATMKELASFRGGVKVVSSNNFPTGAGIASSASGFSALTKALASLFFLEMSTRELASLSSRFSGSSARSFIDGWCSWEGGSSIEQVAPCDHWGLCDIVLVFSTEHKKIHSYEGNRLAATSPLNACRIEEAKRIFTRTCDAVRGRDFNVLMSISERDALMMHSVMMTSTPSLFY